VNDRDRYRWFSSKPWVGAPGASRETVPIDAASGVVTEKADP
jgi:hypothetical protein